MRINKLKDLAYKNAKQANKTAALTMALAVVLVGAIFLIATKAAVHTASIEPEMGTRSANAVVANDTSASNSKYVAFKAPSTGGGGGGGGGSTQTVSIAAAGDISGQTSNDAGTAKLINSRLANLTWILPLGDLQYPDGGPGTAYSKTWGAFKAKTKPTPGNHDYRADGGAGFYKYFSGLPKYYSFNTGAWHLISLNSQESSSSTSAQAKWLQSDLAANSSKCTLAFMHYPRYSSPGSGNHGNITSVAPLWDLMIKAKADVVLAGHDHKFEHFQPMDSAGNIDTVNGLDSFVVGTGGGGLDPVGTSKGSLGGASTWGVLFMDLKPDSYSWQFVDVNGKTLKTGTGTCH